MIMDLMGISVSIFSTGFLSMDVVLFDGVTIGIFFCRESVRRDV